MRKGKRKGGKRRRCFVRFGHRLDASPCGCTHGHTEASGVALACARARRCGGYRASGGLHDRDRPGAVRLLQVADEVELDGVRLVGEPVVVVLHRWLSAISFACSVCFANTSQTPSPRRGCTAARSTTAAAPCVSSPHRDKTQHALCKMSAGARTEESKAYIEKEAGRRRQASSEWRGASPDLDDERPGVHFPPFRDVVVGFQPIVSDDAEDSRLDHRLAFGAVLASPGDHLEDLD